MEPTIFINDDFINNNTNFTDLISVLKMGFASDDIIVPQRHHHDFPNPEMGKDSTLFLMPAWNPSKEAGVKIATVSPKNEQLELPSVQAIYVLMNAKNGTMKAILQSRSLTAKRTAAASALASSYLSKTNSKSLLMIGTGVLSTDLIRAHASVRPIKTVFVWGRNFEKAKRVCDQLKNENFECEVVNTIAEIISEVDIVSCATLSKVPLVLGRVLRAGQHIDLVGAYKKDMREADDEVIRKASVFVDALSGIKESGDIFVPLTTGILNADDIKGDLFALCCEKAKGRMDDEKITVFKSVGNALEDLVAASYYYNQFINA